MNQKINSILLSSRWRSKSCSTIPPSNIYHSPAVGFFRPIPSSLVNSSSLIPKTRPNRSVRKSVIRTCSVLLKEHGLSSEPIVNGRNVARTGSRRRFPTLESSDLGHIRDAPTRSARNSFGCTSRRYFRKLVEHKTLSRRLREVSHSGRKDINEKLETKILFFKKCLGVTLLGTSRNMLMTLCFIFCACFYSAPSKAEGKPRLILV